MVAEDTNTAPSARVSATPFWPNRMVSVWAALTTTLTTMSASFAAAAGVAAPLPPSDTNRSTTPAAASQPVTSNPARLSALAMPYPIEPSPMTATRGLTEADMRRSLDSFQFRFPAYHGLAVLPKRETRYHHERKQNSRRNLPSRTVAVRARPDAGFVRQYFREARWRRLAGDADQRFAGVSRSGA